MDLSPRYFPEQNKFWGIFSERKFPRADNFLRTVLFQGFPSEGDFSEGLSPLMVFEEKKSPTESPPSFPNGVFHSKGMRTKLRSRKRTMPSCNPFFALKAQSWVKAAMKVEGWNFPEQAKEKPIFSEDQASYLNKVEYERRYGGMERTLHGQLQVQGCDETGTTLAWLHSLMFLKRSRA